MGSLGESSTYVRMMNSLEALGLDAMASALPGYEAMVSGGEMDFCTAIMELAAMEVDRKNSKETERRVKSAGFPYVKTLDDFDFGFQPSVHKPTVIGLSSLGFLERAENVLLVGNPGVGKTHIAIALGVEAVRARKEVRFIDCARLVADLKDAASRGLVEKRIKYYAHCTLLIIDELGYLDIDDEGADLLFRLVSARYEHRSTIVTTNVGIGAWADVFGDAVTASAIADRLVHHCTLMKITGPSYRMKDLPRDTKRIGEGA